MKKIILIILIILLILFAGFVVFYGITKQQGDKGSLKMPYTIVVKEDKKEITTERLDKEVFANNIINDMVISYNYDLVDGEDSIYGQVYIKNGYLYIYDERNNTAKKISNDLIKTLFIEENNSSLLSFFAISEKGKVYYYAFHNLDIDDYIFYEYKNDFYVTNFTGLSFKSLYNTPRSNLIVLASNGKMYDVKTGIRYNDKIISLDEKYYVYEDNTIVNTWGNLIKDDGEYLKIKYFIETLDDDRPYKDINSIVITEDNKLIYAEDNSNAIYKTRFKVNEITFEESDNDSKKIQITFEDGSRINFTGYCGDYYYLK